MKQPKSAIKNKVDPKDLARVLRCLLSPRADILAYMLENKSTTNRVIGTHKSIAKKVGVHEKTVARTLQKLTREGIVTNIRHGVWMLSPRIFESIGGNARHKGLKAWKESIDSKQ